MTVRPREGIAVVALTIVALVPAVEAIENTSGEAWWRDQRLAPARVPANAGNTTLPSYEVVFEGTAEEKTATAAATWRSEDATETYQLKLTGPLDEGTKEATPLTLDGLQGEASAEFTFQHILLHNGRDAEAQELLCRLAGADIETCGDHRFRAADGKAIIRDLRSDFRLAGASDKEALCRIVGKKRCGESDLLAVNMLEAYYAAIHGLRRFNLWGITAGASRASFEYLTPEDLEDAEEHHNNWKIGAHVGHYRPKLGYLRLGVAYKSAYGPGEASASEICQPIEDADAQRCREIVVGAPSNRESTIATLEWRYFLPGGKLAISPSLSRDFKNEVTSYVLPIYFLGAKGGLTGGARIGYETENEKVTFAIFVGAALKVVGD